MAKSVVIDNPQLELQLLRELVALNGDNPDNFEDNRVKASIEDYSANRERATAILNSLQGRHIYKNDNCPWHADLVFFYDLTAAYRMLSSIKARIGAANFSNCKIVLEELLLGVDFTKIEEFKNIRFAANEPPHHVITRAYNIPKNGSFQANPSLSSLSRKTQETLYNLQLYNRTNVLFSWVIENPDRELRLLREIAGTDGNAASISEADMRSASFQAKLRQLEGYRLYTNDHGQDATQSDLNSAYTLLDTLAGQYDLAHSDVLLSEKMRPDNERRVITDAQIILNEVAGNFVRIRNFGQ
ncbi:MAG: hypothetical protein LBD99_02560 [Candidatus Margulisbacteria bacterium]|nr:hypothetical protein [Candidatus Margulisiibacteriota bacterium]